MAGPTNLFDVAGRAMSAQLVRMNSSASNLANAGSISGSERDAYRSIKPVFRTELDKSTGLASVSVDRMVRSNAQAERQHDPDHPLADENGDVWVAAVDESQEMVEMMESARQYQNMIEVLQTAKSLMLETMRVK